MEKVKSFEIWHKECGKTFQIHSDTFFKKEPNELICPHCKVKLLNDTLIETETGTQTSGIAIFKTFLKNYVDTAKLLGNSTIREIPPNNLKAKKPQPKPPK